MPTDTPSTAAEGRGGKLTDPQWCMLHEAAIRPQRVVRGYKPAEKLAALGLVEIAITDAPYPWIVKATPAGREALSREKE